MIIQRNEIQVMDGLLDSIVGAVGGAASAVFKTATGAVVDLGKFTSDAASHVSKLASGTVKPIVKPVAKAVTPVVKPVVKAVPEVVKPIAKAPITVAKPAVKAVKKIDLPPLNQVATKKNITTAALVTGAVVSGGNPALIAMAVKSASGGGGVIGDATKLAQPLTDIMNIANDPKQAAIDLAKREGEKKLNEMLNPKPSTISAIGQSVVANAQGAIEILKNSEITQTINKNKSIIIPAVIGLGLITYFIYRK